MPERRYTVRWSRTTERPEDVLVCTRLDVRTAFARLVGAIRNSGPIVVHAIEAEASDGE